MKRDDFARVALRNIPKLLTLQDRNPYSSTFGCFDRNYWHYKMIDFPSGMAQEFVYPIALAYCLDIPGNAFYRNAALPELIVAGIRYAAKTAHRNGSCDDYYPYEQATGASAFSLLAFVEAYSLLNLHDERLLAFFSKRADWLADHQESGRLANHEGLVVCCLHRLGKICNSDRWKDRKRKRLERLLQWQSDEGWFHEYEGCDPGYQTLTISLLAQLQSEEPSDAVRDSLAKAIGLAAEFVHPDGSYGGEYGSRNTYNFFPHGFELAGRWLPEALAVNDAVLPGIERGLAPSYEDDHIIGHHTWSYLLAWRHFLPRPADPISGRKLRSSRVYLKNAGIFIDRREDTELYAALNKGGVYKLFRNGVLVVSDTQICILMKDGKIAVGHLIKPYQLRVEEKEISISGKLSWAKQNKMNTPKLILFRIAMATAGRFFPDAIRSFLQKLLITGIDDAPFDFNRVFTYENGKWFVKDELRAADWNGVQAVGIGPAQTSIYVVMSRTFQQGQLLPWLDLTDRLRQLRAGEPLMIEREF